MSEGASKVNGLTTEHLAENGVPVSEVLDIYTKLVEDGHILVAFNAQYDMKIMRGELRRAERDDLFERTPNICVMRACIDICCIPKARGGGFKFPKLAEACEHFGITNLNAHDAMGDASAALDIFRILRDRGALPEPAVYYAKTPPSGKVEAAQ
jgi:DNA polymerase III epsilon subunit-like protein